MIRMDNSTSQKRVKQVNFDVKKCASGIADIAGTDLCRVTTIYKSEVSVCLKVSDH